MPLIRGLLRITPARPVQKRAPDSSESRSGSQIVMQNFCFVHMVAGNISKPKKHSSMHVAHLGHGGRGAEMSWKLIEVTV